MNSDQKRVLDQLRRYLSEAALQPELDDEVAKMIELYLLATKRVKK